MSAIQPLRSVVDGTVQALDVDGLERYFNGDDARTKSLFDGL